MLSVIDQYASAQTANSLGAQGGKYVVSGATTLQTATPAVVGHKFSYIRTLATTEFTKLTGNITGIITAVKATETLTFTGVVSDTETVTIGTRVYEFDTDATPTITGGRVRVNVTGGVTAILAAAALITAINSDASAVVVASAGSTTSKVNITAKLGGIAGNALASTETCANASFGGVVLSGGVAGTSFASGFELRGRFTEVELALGTAIMYEGN